MPLYPLKRLRSLLDINIFIVVAFYGLALVILDVLLLRISPSEISSFEKLSDVIFGKLWVRIDSITFNKELDTALPGLVASASGVVVELGPGSGNQCCRYDKSKVTKIYGIEPNPAVHEKLLTRVHAAGLQDIYTLIPCGIEDGPRLLSFGLKDGMADTVLTCQVLCGVPQPKLMVKRCYDLLKPGGRLVAYEHVRATDGISRSIQNVYQKIWPYLMGNCNLNRPTGDYLLAAGNWAKVDMKLPEDDDPWLTIPHISGTLVKSTA